MSVFVTSTNILICNDAHTIKVILWKEKRREKKTVDCLLLQTLASVSSHSIVVCRLQQTHSNWNCIKLNLLFFFPLLPSARNWKELASRSRSICGYRCNCPNFHRYHTQKKRETLPTVTSSTAKASTSPMSRTSKHFHSLFSAFPLPLSVSRLFYTPFKKFNTTEFTLYFTNATVPYINPFRPQADLFDESFSRQRKRKKNKSKKERCKSLNTCIKKNRIV